MLRLRKPSDLVTLRPLVEPLLHSGCYILKPLVTKSLSSLGHSIHQLFSFAERHLKFTNNLDILVNHSIYALLTTINKYTYEIAS